METFTPALVEEAEITELIPQRFPFIMVHRLLHSDEEKTICSFTVREDNIFTIAGVLEEPALIENIAQTAATRIGYSIYKAKLEGKESAVQVGFIGAISNLSITELPKLGAEVITEVTFEKEVLDVILIKGVSTVDNREMACCEMKIFIKKN